MKEQTSVSQPITLRAFKAVKDLMRERDELEAHTHGFAYDECPKCRRLADIRKLLKGTPR